MKKNPVATYEAVFDGAVVEASEVRAGARMRASMREQTAATILAALTSGRMVPDTNPLLDVDDHDNVRYAVALADALRSALEGP